MVLGISCLSRLGFSQEYDPEYFMFPIRPGEQNYLAGTMGELRSTHFHTGIDIKTSGISGLPVYAAADGYISRIKISSSGYGNALYLTHPNGTTTVYAHLREFKEPTASFVRKKQYEQESFAVDISVPKNQIPIKKREVIALSGNSGSSSGPHLHFEVRDANQQVLNPLKFKFDEIKDDLPPTLSHVAFVTMDIDSRVNGMFGRFEFAVKEAESGHELEAPVTLSGKIGVEMYAYDKLNGANNRNGIIKEDLILDEQTVFSQHIDRLSFALSRNILVHANYKRMMEGGRRFDKLYLDDGNFLKFYNVNSDRGILQINDPFKHVLDVRLEDSYGNVSQYRLNVNNQKYALSDDYKHDYGLKNKGYDLVGNILEMRVKRDTSECFARMYVEGKETLLAKSYRVSNTNYYLWDTKKGLPDSMVVCEERINFDFQKVISPKSRETFSNESVALDLPSYALFDTLALQFKKTASEIGQKELFSFGNYDQPLRKSVTINLKPDSTYNQEHSFAYSLYGKSNMNFVGGKWSGNELTFKTRDLVRYTIVTDTIPPEITSMKANSGRLRFRIRDKLSGIKSFRSELNGEWLLMNYDAKTATLRSDPKVKVSGDFVLIVEDNSGNETEWRSTY